MKRYETIVIVDPDLAEEDRKSFVPRLEEIIPQQGGTLLLVDDWGVKKLAYNIRKRSRGHYIRLDYCGDGALVAELERFFRIDDRALKYMTVLLDEAVDVETAKAEIEAAQQAAEEAAAPAEPEAEVTEETETEAAATEEAAPEKPETAEAESDKEE
ncbi:MAG: 30S ribosomal protein S6 [Desulfobacterales bacterium]|nr:30S ribosomal protein S6 [Desulfobacterales bacterium]